MTTVAIETLGCKLNQAESESLARELLAAGFSIVAADVGADIHIVNTCTVTHVADRKARHRLRLARRRNPSAFVVAAGCYAERAGPELEGADMVVGADKTPLVETLLGTIKYGNAVRGEPFDVAQDRPVESTTAFALRQARCERAVAHFRGNDSKGGNDKGSTPFRTRSRVKIQDGCDAFCTYCIVPHVRGRERSMPPDRVLAEVKARVSEGCREVVLTGSRAGAYRHSGAAPSTGSGQALEYLLRRVLGETEVARVRLSSLQPREITPGLLALWSDPRLCRHFHLSLQSGSSSVLERMGREYTVEEYGDTVSAIRARVPGAGITTDVIAGFPGETAEEFEESYRFCRQSAFAGIHVFPFSPRSGTPAAAMPGQVSDRVKSERKARLLRLARESAGRFREPLVGQRALVLWETDDSGRWSGLTDNYVRVLASAPGAAVNDIAPVRLVGVGVGCLTAEPA